MPTFLLPEDFIVFPHPLLADDIGLLAVGESLTIEQLKLAYHFGIFPWFNPGEMVQWFFPNPRSVIFPDEIKVAKSMRTYFNNPIYHWTHNQAFYQVIRQCRSANGRVVEGTWIGNEIISAYTELHREGLAHSIEVWKEDKLVGGLYGIWNGKVFFGESMFSLEKNASKFGLISFTRHFSAKGKLNLIDCQIENDHLNSLGARNIKGADFLDLLKKWAWV